MKNCRFIKKNTIAISKGFEPHCVLEQGKCANQNSLDSIYAPKIDLTNYFVAKSESNLFSKYGDNDLWKYVRSELD